MTTRKMFTILLVANLLTVALVTAVFQVGGLAAASPALPTGSDQPAAHDPNLVPIVPWYMNYQGILKDSGGAPLDGTYDLTFTIYRWDQLTASYVSVWTETHNSVQVTNGLFNVSLGTQGSPLRGDVFAGMGVNGTWDGELALGVTVDGGTELSPRISLSTVPYAHRAEYVNRFPAPHWDSGWYTIAQAETKTWTHNLGGDTDDYIVDLQFKSAARGVNQETYGGGYDDIGGSYGAHWRNLTPSQITVGRATGDWAAEQVRVRIWRIE